MRQAVVSLVGYITTSGFVVKETGFSGVEDIAWKTYQIIFKKI